MESSCETVGASFCGGVVLLFVRTLTTTSFSWIGVVFVDTTIITLLLSSLSSIVLLCFSSVFVFVIFRRFHGGNAAAAAIGAFMVGTASEGLVLVILAVSMLVTFCEGAVSGPLVVLVVFPLIAFVPVSSS